MAVTWIVLGASLLILTLIDTFFAVLNYNEPGIIVNRVARAQWVIIRSITRRLPRPWRSFALRQTTGIIMVSVIFCWLIGVILGFALIYFGALQLGQIKIEPGAPEGFWAALYLSIGQFSTVGVENMSAVYPIIDFLTVIQALCSVVMLTMIITFLFNVFNGVQMLRSLCADVSMPDDGINEPLTVLEPYFPNGKPEGLERWMQSTWGDMNLYGDSLRQTRTAYYFQSGEHQFSAPFAMGTLSGIIGALRWGLPTGFSPVSTLPQLMRLEESVQAAQDWISKNMLRARASAIPKPLSEAEFTEQLTQLRDPKNIGVNIDEWVARFDRICRASARLTSAEQSDQLARDADPAEVYQRYLAWLPYGVGQDHFLSALSQDLDYQPLYTGVAKEPFYSDGVARPLENTALPSPKHRVAPLVAWFRRRQWFVDPGWFRASAGVTTLITAALALFTTALAGAFLQFDASNVFAFSALLTLYVPAMVPAKRNIHSFMLGLLALIPTVGMSILAIFTPDNWLATVIWVSAVAFLAIFIGRFGPRFGAAGQLAFGAYFMALILDLEPVELPAVITASAIAVIWTVSLRMLPQLGIRSRVLKDGTRGVLVRTETVISDVITAVGSGINSKAMQHRISKAARSVHLAGTTLGGRLSTLRDPGRSRGLSENEIVEFRMRLLDLELAVNHLAQLPFQKQNVDLTVSDRAVICARLEQLLAQLRQEPAAKFVAPPDFIGPVVQSFMLSATELEKANLRLQKLDEEDFALSAASANHTDSAAAATAAGGGSEAIQAASSGNNASKRSIQAALATSIALSLGSLVSQHHQYWAAMPAFQSLQGSDGHTRASALGRVFMTTVGALVGFSLAIIMAHELVLVLSVLGICVFALGYNKGPAPMWYVLWMNAMMALMYDALGSLSAELIGIRVVETLIGAAVAAIIASFVFPLRTRTKLKQALAKAISSIATAASSGLGKQINPDSISSETLNQQLSEMDAAITKYQDLALPLRRDIGSLKTSGIESTLSKLWKLAHDAKELSTNAKQTPPRQIEAWTSLKNAAQINFEALAESNQGELAKQYVPVRDLAPALAAFSNSSTKLQARSNAAAALSATSISLCDTIKPGSLPAA